MKEELESLIREYSAEVESEFKGNVPQGLSVKVYTESELNRYAFYNPCDESINVSSEYEPKRIDFPLVHELGESIIFNNYYNEFIKPLKDDITLCLVRESLREEEDLQEFKEGELVITEIKPYNINENEFLLFKEALINWEWRMC